ncbi:MAG: hypothetical protein ACJ8AH_13495, partial [Stellaceae bacterium]
SRSDDADDHDRRSPAHAGEEPGDMKQGSGRQFSRVQPSAGCTDAGAREGILSGRANYCENRSKRVLGGRATRSLYNRISEAEKVTLMGVPGVKVEALSPE